MNKIIYFTQKGLEEKKQEYEELLAKRPDAVKELSKAREMGDLSENGYYRGAKFKLSDIDRQLRHLKYVLKLARVKEVQNKGAIDIGSIVTISDGANEKTYSIVGTYESNPAESKISLYSPLGKVLAGKKLGEKAILSIGEKQTEFTILSIK